MRPTRIVAAIVAIGVVSAAIWYGATAWRDARQLTLGRELYAGRCAGCHGRNLEGQPNWQDPLPNGRMPAPPHDATGHTWHHSDADLLLITKKGVAALVPNYASDMPSFEGVLNEDEINAVLAFIKSTWPEREREYQRLRSEMGRR